MRHPILLPLTAGLLLSLSLQGLLRGEDWPMWQYDAARSGASPMVLPEVLHLNWVRQLPEPRRAWPAQGDDRDKLEFDLSYSPVVLGERIFVPSMVTDSLTALDVDRGEELWRYYTDGPVRLAPAAAGGRVYFVSDDGHLYCLDARSGDLKWKFRGAPAESRLLGNGRLISMWPARGAPVVYDGTVYFAAGIWPFQGIFLYALDAESGKVVWENTGIGTDYQRQPHGGAYAFAGVAPQGYLAATDDRLVVSGGRSTPALFDRHTGELVHQSVGLDGKEIGGYRIETDGEFYYNHGRKYLLADGSAAGSGNLRNEAILGRVEEIQDHLDGQAFATLAARGRLFVVTTRGTLYCFGPEAREVKVHQVALEPLRPAGDAWSERAEAILEETGTREGFGLVLGAGSGRLLEELLVKSELHLVVVEPDAEKVARLRKRLTEAGVYGTRIAVHAGDPSRFELPPYLFALIAGEESPAGGDVWDENTVARLFRHLRPYGGTAHLPIRSGSAAELARRIERAGLEGAQVAAGTESVRLTRTGPLPGADQWTHQYSDSANTVFSRDERVRLPLGILWFGGPSNQHVLPRHSAGPRPQVAGGRLVILGVETISARDVYTGRELWVKELPGVGHPFTNLELEEDYRRGKSVYMTNKPGASYIGSPYVTLPDSIYLRYGTQVLRLDPQTGETLAEFPLGREPLRGEPTEWGHLSVSDDLLIATNRPQIFDDNPLGEQNWNASSSERLTVMNRFTGEVLWSRDAELGFRHNAIVSAGGRLFLVDGLSDKALEALQRRGRSPSARSKMLALDARRGELLWQCQDDIFGTWLSYSSEHDVLLEGGSQDGRRPLADEPRDRMAARRGSDGTVIWRRSGRIDGPVVIRGEEILPGRPGTARCLLTGTDQMREHPLTGEEMARSSPSLRSGSARRIFPGSASTPCSSTARTAYPGWLPPALGGSPR